MEKEERFALCQCVPYSVGYKAPVDTFWWSSCLFPTPTYLKPARRCELVPHAELCRQFLLLPQSGNICPDIWPSGDRTGPKEQMTSRRNRIDLWDCDSSTWCWVTRINLESKGSCWGEPWRCFYNLLTWNHKALWLGAHQEPRHPLGWLFGAGLASQKPLQEAWRGEAFLRNASALPGYLLDSKLSQPSKLNCFFESIIHVTI